MTDKTNPWFRILLLIGCGFLALTAWSVYRASHDTSGVVDRDYYSHGLRYNQSRLEQQAAVSRGWTTRIELDGNRLLVSLADRQGEPVPQAKAELVLFDTASTKGSSRPLQEISPGRYQGDIPGDLQGETPAEIRFDRQGARLSRRLLLSLRDDR